MQNPIARPCRAETHTKRPCRPASRCGTFFAKGLRVRRTRRVASPHPHDPFIHTTTTGLTGAQGEHPMTPTTANLRNRSLHGWAVAVSIASISVFSTSPATAAGPPYNGGRVLSNVQVVV